MTEIRPEHITKEIRVIDITKCLECKTCERSCARRHGFQRNVRKGIKIGHFIVPYACKHCDDPQCIKNCKKGALKQDPDTGVIYHNKENCAGCGSCAKKCPFGSILMEDTGRFREVKDKEGGVKKIIIKYANKCDHCREYKKKGCYVNCPAGAQTLYIPFNILYETLPPKAREKLKNHFLNGYWIKGEQEGVCKDEQENNRTMAEVGI